MFIYTGSSRISVNDIPEDHRFLEPRRQIKADLAFAKANLARTIPMTWDGASLLLYASRNDKDLMALSMHGPTAPVEVKTIAVKEPQSTSEMRCLYSRALVLRTLSKRASGSFLM